MLYQKYINLFKQGEFETGFSERMSDYGIKFWLSNLEKALNDSSKRVFLDIGAGQGRWSVFFANNGFERGFAIEVDVDKLKWQKILEKYENIKLLDGFLQDNIHSIPEEVKIDFILLAEVFEHIPHDDTDLFIDSLYRILATEGRIFLTTPNFTVCGPAEKSKCWHKIQPYGHHKHYSLNELIDKFKKKNFKVDFYNFESGWLKKNLYNRFFYPISRLDQKLLTSCKIPTILRKSYKYTSYPLFFFVRSFFYLLAQIVNQIESRTNSENNSETIILVLRKD